MKGGSWGYEGYDEDTSNFTLNVIGTNDIHGQALPDGTTNAGLANAAYKINSLKNTYKYNLNKVLYSFIFG